MKTKTAPKPDSKKKQPPHPKPKDGKKALTFEGVVRCVSSSPHGHPEGVVFEDGTFLKIPPHTLLAPDQIVVGAKLEGEGELVAETPNRVFNHATVRAGKTVVADDRAPPHVNEERKETHHEEIEALKKSEKPAKKRTVRATLEAVGQKADGKVDRLILSDGTSVHLKKELAGKASDFEIGDEIEVTGETRDFGALRFMKATDAARATA